MKTRSFREPPHVVVLGGGVSGLSAAQELAERGMRVSLFEKRHWGGKVRSMGKPGTGKDGRRDLPGEHGFHFFPWFYQHLPDTMKRIPFEGKPQGVFDNLVRGSREMITRVGEPDLIAPSRIPQSLSDWVAAFKLMFALPAGMSAEEIKTIAERIWVYLASCQERRDVEFDRVSWWDFTEAGRFSKEYQSLIATMPTTLLVAVRPRSASTRTIGNAMIQFFLTAFRYGTTLDRNLMGPTEDFWVRPWRDHLQSLGVAQHNHAPVTRINLANGRVSSVTITRDGRDEDVTGDYYVFALPVEAMTRLVTPELRSLAPSLANIHELQTEWMSGIQFFLKKPLPLVNGHVGYDDSAWKISSVSQDQFWTGFPWENYGAGDVREVFSVILSDWQTPGTEKVKKPADRCTEEELIEETLAQVMKHLNKDGEVLRREDIVDWSIDPDISFPRGSSGENENAEPLMVSTVGAWSLRPDAWTEVPNLLVASDYVRTYMDFASAEGANEAARRAVNAILDTSGFAAPRCRIFPPDSFHAFAPLQALDRWRYRRGLPPYLGPILPGR